MTEWEKELDKKVKESNKQILHYVVTIAISILVPIVIVILAK